MADEKKTDETPEVEATAAEAAPAAEEAKAETEHAVAEEPVIDNAGSTPTPTTAPTEAADTQSAQDVGKRVAERAKAAGVTRVIFDRGGFLFHGRVKALADAAREGGLEF